MGFSGDGISVVIPAYNRAGLLERAVRSVLTQSRTPKEVIIVDDGSTDETKQTSQFLSDNTDIPLRYFYQQNKGPAAARNKGIEHVSSPLIAFLDSDDYWEKNKLEIQAEALEAQREYNISHTMEQWYRRGVHLNQKKKHQPPHGDIFNRCLSLCCVGMSTVMIRKEIFLKYGLFNQELKCCEDYDYWLRTAVSERFLLIDKKLTVKDGGRADQVSNIYRQGMDRFRIRAIMDLIEKKELSFEQKEQAMKELKRKCTIYGNGCIKHGKISEGKKFLSIPENIEMMQERK